MNVFDMIGPVMIGPSSSHTAGAVRLGRVAYKLMNGAQPKDVTIALSGSFAQTYKGHGTDKALLAGIMGYHSWHEEIRSALDIAAQRGISYKFIPTEIPNSHPNTARISFTCTDGTTGSVQGASIGGGNIRVDEVNGMAVKFTGENTTILILHYDRPGVIAEVTNLLREEYSWVNIGNFRLSRPVKGGEALMMIEIDGELPDEEQMKHDLNRLENVINVVVIKAL